MTGLLFPTPARRALARLSCACWLALLSGCAIIPPVVEPVTWLIAGVSYITTSKGPSDHALSMVTKKDCSLFRLLTLGRVCVPVNAETNESLIVHVMHMLRGQSEPAAALPEVAVTAATPSADAAAFPENPLLRAN